MRPRPRRKKSAPPAASWDRVKEILVVVPESGWDSVPPAAWARLFRGLAPEWRVFWVRAPQMGERVAKGGAGLDPVSLDTLPVIKRVLAQHVISAVFLVGESAAASCLEPLHAFASHVPYVVVLDEPWRAPKPGEGHDMARLEFMMGLADRIVLTNAGLRESIEPFLRRVTVPIDVMPADARPAVFQRFVKECSASIREMFRGTHSGVASPASAAVLGVLSESAPAACEALVQEWRLCLPGSLQRTILYPAEFSRSGLRRLEKLWPRTSWLAYRDEPHKVELANRALRSGACEFSLILADGVRLTPLTAERILACGAKLPLVGAVCGSSAPQPPAAWPQWIAFGGAWAMRHNGSYRLTPYIREDFFLVRRAAVECAGLLDARLGWRLAVRDYCLRLRQAGLNLFIAEDAVVQSATRPHQDGSESAFNTIFVDKWNLDPLALAK